MVPLLLLLLLCLLIPPSRAPTVPPNPWRVKGREFLDAFLRVVKNQPVPESRGHFVFIGDTSIRYLFDEFRNPFAHTAWNSSDRCHLNDFFAFPKPNNWHKPSPHEGPLAYGLAHTNCQDCPDCHHVLQHGLRPNASSVEYLSVEFARDVGIQTPTYSHHTGEPGAPLFDPAVQGPRSSGPDRERGHPRPCAARPHSHIRGQPPFLPDPSPGTTTGRDGRLAGDDTDGRDTPVPPHLVAQLNEVSVKVAVDTGCLTLDLLESVTPYVHFLCQNESHNPTIYRGLAHFMHSALH
eukprot:TRINITY_DN4579_c0_g1_i1.p1 TRINITY_DN4579_c0_g1~~TRINITY_DN4579_c0_g1_i1.p1  ORF type:complete len:302 (+),score=27.22 TRINITY_DN4579_c0_g1_i1:28-906(+)